MTEASPDSKVYKRGYVIGGKILKPSSKNTQESSSRSESKKQISEEFQNELEAWASHGIVKAAHNQMSEGSGEEKD